MRASSRAARRCRASRASRVPSRSRITRVWPTTASRIGAPVSVRVASGSTSRRRCGPRSRSASSVGRVQASDRAVRAGQVQLVGVGVEGQGGWRSVGNAATWVRLGEVVDRQLGAGQDVQPVADATAGVLGARPARLDGRSDHWAAELALAGHPVVAEEPRCRAPWRTWRDGGGCTRRCCAARRSASPGGTPSRSARDRPRRSTCRTARRGGSPGAVTADSRMHSARSRSSRSRRPAGSRGERCAPVAPQRSAGDAVDDPVERRRTTHATDVLGLGRLPVRGRHPSGRRLGSPACRPVRPADGARWTLRAVSGTGPRSTVPWTSAAASAKPSGSRPAPRHSRQARTGRRALMSSTAQMTNPGDRDASPRGRSARSSVP